MKSILILGATSDVAKAVGRRYAQKKYKVLLAARSLATLAKIGDDMSIRFETEVHCFRFDASDYGTHAAFYNSLGCCPDIVVCAFGYLGNQFEAQVTWEECNSILIANYSGAISMLNIVANEMELRKSGVIVGISSVAGDRGRQSNYFYGSAKAGFTAFLSGLRNRLSKCNINVITVKPGFINTRMTEGRKLPSALTANPDQVASKIFKAVEKGSNVIYVLSIWRWIMLIIKLIPEPIFKKLKL